MPYICDGQMVVVNICKHKVFVLWSDCASCCSIQNGVTRYKTQPTLYTKTLPSDRTLQDPRHYLLLTAGKMQTFFLGKVNSSTLNFISGNFLETYRSLLISLIRSFIPFSVTLFEVLTLSRSS
jgi:hypothetical protein